MTFPVITKAKGGKSKYYLNDLKVEENSRPGLWISETTRKFN